MSTLLVSLPFLKFKKSVFVPLSASGPSMVPCYFSGLPVSADTPRLSVFVTSSYRTELPQESTTTSIVSGCSFVVTPTSNPPQDGIEPTPQGHKKDAKYLEDYGAKAVIIVNYTTGGSSLTGSPSGFSESGLTAASTQESWTTMATTQPTVTPLSTSVTRTPNAALLSLAVSTPPFHGNQIQELHDLLLDSFLNNWQSIVTVICSLKEEAEKNKLGDDDNIEGPGAGMAGPSGLNAINDKFQ